MHHGEDDDVVQPEDQKAWSQATLAKVDHVKSRQEQIRKALAELEGKEQERIAVQIAERQRLAASAAALERKKARDAMLKAEEERKRLLVAEMKAVREEVEKSKHHEKAAIKAATAQFLLKTQLDTEAREKIAAMKAMSDAVQKVGLAASRCQHESRMKFSAVKVCEMRLEMRESRPTQEAWRDEVDEALEKELQVLNAAREELHQCARSGEQVKVEISEVQALLTTGTSRDNVTKRLQKSSSLPALVATMTPAPSFQDLLARGASLVEKADRVDATCQSALQRTHEDCGKATARVANCFAQRSSATGVLKANLEHHKKEVSANISQAEKRVQMLKLRAHRTPETPRSAEATQQQIQDVEALISELREGKRHLEDDYRNKTSSFKVDKSCMGLTKVKAGSHVGKSRLSALTTVE